MSDNYKYISKMSFDGDVYYLKDNEARADVDDLIKNKVDSVEGMGLSKNNFSDEYKNLVDTTANDLSGHTTNKENPHGVTAAQLGLSNVENKSSETIRSEITSEDVTSALGFTPVDNVLIGTANGVATLDESGLIPSSQLPSYVDDVLEYAGVNNFPNPGESGKVYVDTDTNVTYRWSGSQYTVIGSDLAIGETAVTAFRGDYGKVAYEHALSNHAPDDAERNIIVSVLTNGEVVEVGTNREVDIKIPTKLSDLENDVGYNEYIHPSYTAKEEGLYKVTIDELGHVSSVTPVTDSDIEALGVKITDTTYETGTTVSSGITKLYDNVGEGTDGTITQKVISERLNLKANTADLGTAAGTDVGDYATALQGTKADSAVQSVLLGEIEVKEDTVVKLPAYPTELPASDVKEWAKAEEKPQYTPEEVGAASKLHTHGANEVTNLTGYEKPISSASIEATDSLNIAIGKLERALDAKQPSGSYSTTDHNHDDVYYTETETDELLKGKVDTTLLGVANGVATLDENGVVESSQLPSYVDDVLEFDTFEDLPDPGEGGKVYVVTATNVTYRWSGTQYTVIGSDLAIGETAQSAFRGDYGKIAYEHSQLEHARADATKTTASETNGNIVINDEETTVYTHPIESGYGHIPAGGSVGQSLVYAGDGVAKWGNSDDSMVNAVVSNNGDTVRYNYTDGSYEIMNVLDTNSYKIETFSSADELLTTVVTTSDADGNITVERY